MPGIKNQLSEIHGSRQTVQHILLVYTLISLSIADYIAEAEVLFGPYVENLLTGNDNKYSASGAMLVDLVIVFAVLFPLFCIVKMLLVRKYQNEFTAIDRDSEKEV